ncbi:MAG: colanic acid biosynthesis acetyltransferase WcaF [Bacteroidota bacterium]|jgi:putative colanic acid biosynthesis acetyltransferase WcaF
MQVDLSDYNNRNKAYRASIGASVFKQILWLICSVMIIRNPLIPFSGLRRLVLLAFGAKIGQSPVIKPGVIIKYPWKLVMGDFVWLGENCWIDNLAAVTIGNHCCISQGAMLCTGNHDYRSPHFDLIMKPIVLEAGVWIGACSIVGPGVHCSTQSVLTAGSVLTSNMEANMIYQGNPATLKRSRI